jgi:hypothetical protein
VLSLERVFSLVYSACILPGMIGALGYAMWKDGRRFKSASEEDNRSRKARFIKLKYPVPPGTQKPL